MPPFPWDTFKAETLRLMCKDLGAGVSVKRARGDMILFLKGVEIQGLVGMLEDSRPQVESSTPDIADGESRSEPESTPVVKSDDEELKSEHEGSELGHSNPDVPWPPGSPACSCQDGWLSPRMRFILSTVAAVASDVVLDTGDMAIEQGDAAATHLAQYIPGESLPRGKKSVELWVEGFSTIFLTIRNLFKAGKIPGIDTLEEALGQLPKDKQKFVKAYGKKGAELDSVLEALVYKAREEWEADFQDVYCGKESGWDRLPKCSKHDLAWITVEDMLIE